ncbi:iron chaperone [Flavobacterium sp. 7A]|uniref:iron chaperone n=1 Tax=Flavobacterium sp. 7A TaxID=2940571 RepID=UPI002227A450|nr:DUF1801 domain-containing protein [Flavobacterium sp. 7A]MCW2118858.1 uncharacterized protein YdhG (YjbR/CyaY superfamily) [Flavobacterium sp. 7A]
MSEKDNLKTVAEYFNAQPERTKKMLLELKKRILQGAPNAIELFNYNIPSYSLIEGGKREHQIMIAGYKNHVGFYPHPTTIEKFETDLTEFKKGKGSVQFPLDKPLPTELIIKMVVYRKEQINQQNT